MSWPAATASPGNLFEIQILLPHSRSTESETLGLDSAICVSPSNLGDSDVLKGEYWHTSWWIKVVSEVNWSRFKFQFCLSVIVWLGMSYIACWASLVAQTAKKLPAMQAIQVWPLGWKDSLEKGMATHSTIVTWRIPRTEEPGGLQSMGSQRVEHDWHNLAHPHTCHCICGRRETRHTWGWNEAWNQGLGPLTGPWNSKF